MSAVSALMVRPATIGASELTSTSATNSGSAYSSSTTYVANDAFYYDTTGRKYLATMEYRSTWAINVVDDGGNGYMLTPEPHGFALNERIRVTYLDAGGGTLTEGTHYFVKSIPAPDRLTVSATAGGSTIDISGYDVASDTPLTLFGPLNRGKTPPAFGEESEWFEDQGPTNKMACFDSSTRTQTITTGGSGLSMVVALPSRCDSLALLGISGASHAAIALVHTISSRDNLALRSQQFDNGSWSKTNVTATADQVVAPDGTTTADKVAATASATTTLSQTITAGGSGTGHVYSIYVKKGSGATDANRFRLRNSTTATDLAVLTLDYDAGTVTQTTGSGAALTATGFLDWWRLTIPASSGISGGNSLVIYAGFTGSAETAGEYCYLWGAQLEEGAAATAYIPTTTASVSSTTATEWQGYDLADTEAFDDDWYAADYVEAVYRSRIAVSALRPYSSASVNVKLFGSGTVGLGNCVPGLSKDIGVPSSEVPIGFDSFSLVEFDDFGSAEITPRTGSDRASFELVADAVKAKALRDLFKTQRDTPTLYLMKRDADSPGGWDPDGIFWGIIRDFERIATSNPEEKFSFELKGLT